MREIKYRGKCIETGKWIRGSLLITDVDTEIADEKSCIRSRRSVDPDTVGEFTGLKDSNGNDIYEGDILKYETPKYPNHKPYVIKWSEEDCCFECVNEDNFMLPSVWGEMEILGDIYDNPDLLEGSV